LCGAVLLIVIISIFPGVSAPSYYSIELIPARWNRATIPVRIDTENQTLHNLVLQALDTWNAAQDWFHTAYSPKGSLYRFEESKNAVVIVGFGTIYEYADNSPIRIPCFDCSGIAYSDYSGGVMKRVEITVSTRSFLEGHAYSEAGILGVTMHELGHALGLRHTSVADDLMYKSVDTFSTPSYSVYPSTLDLYGVATVANGPSTPTQAALPDTIPYKMFPVKRQLVVNVPDQVSVTIDGIAYPAGIVQITLPVGLHTIELPTMVQVSQGSRLMFDSWEGAGTIGPTATYELVLDSKLQAIYKAQYSLVIKGYGNSILQTYWYNSGALAAFVPPVNVPESLKMEGPFGELGGRWRLSGWYDNGQPISPNTSFVVTEPHTIAPQYSADFTIPVALILGSLSAAIIAVYYRKRNQVRIEEQFCISCGAKLPPESKFCNECGFPQN
jgi:hypothetical protein